MPTRFAYRDPGPAAPLLRLLGVRLDRDGVEVTDDGRVRARFGRLRLDVPVDRVASAEVTGPYRWWKAVGPRLSARDTGVTFGTAGGYGVCMRFTEPVGPVFGPRRHAGLSVTVEDPEGLVAAVAAARADAGPPGAAS
jgi:hypothetical protein